MEKHFFVGEKNLTFYIFYYRYLNFWGRIMLCTKFCGKTIWLQHIFKRMEQMVRYLTKIWKLWSNSNWKMSVISLFTEFTETYLSEFKYIMQYFNNQFVSFLKWYVGSKCHKNCHFHKVFCDPSLHKISSNSAIFAFFNFDWFW